MVTLKSDATEASTQQHRASDQAAVCDSLAERTETNVDGQSDVLKPFTNQLPQKLYRDQMKQTIKKKNFYVLYLSTLTRYILYQTRPLTR